MQERYDYIIAGGGCAGLQLALAMISETALQDKRILILDRAPKAGNDRTWCFWSKEESPYAPLLLKTWQHLTICASDFQSTQDIEPYQYGMLRSADFYEYARTTLEAHPRVVFHYGEIQSVVQEGAWGIVRVDGMQFAARYVFNSCIQQGQLNPKTGHEPFWQHFKGWWIKTEVESFDPQKATLMDFRVRQAGGLSFMYVLPVSPTEALVEFTVFSASMLQDQQYDEALYQYLNQELSGVHYEIQETEKGVIPMFPIQETSAVGTSIIPIGGLGGAIKPTTGYAFMRIQSETKHLIAQLCQGKTPVKRLSAQRFPWYDALLLHLLRQHKATGVRIFTQLFKNNPYPLILRFLDEETLIRHEAQIFSRLPIMLFLRAAVEVWWQRFRSQWWPLTSSTAPRTNPLITP